MSVLIACEESGVERRAFRERGYEAYSNDLLPARDGSPYHIQGDAIEALHSRDWPLVIAHPPCTRSANSGVRWLRERNLWMEMIEQALFVRHFIDNIERGAVENPIPHKYALAIFGRKYDQIIQPWMFGHHETKAICLWLIDVPPLVPTNIVDGREARVHRMAPGPNRSRDRSTSYEGIAAAIADQWGRLL